MHSEARVPEYLIRPLVQVAIARVLVVNGDRRPPRDQRPVHGEE